MTPKQRTRWLISSLIFSATAMVLAVAIPYRVNRETRQIAFDTDRVFRNDAPDRRALALANIRRLEALTRWYRIDADIYILEAANLRILGNNRDAARAYESAIRYLPTAELYLNLGMTQLQTGEVEPARASFAQAARFNPELKPVVDRSLADRRPR